MSDSTINFTLRQEIIFVMFWMFLLFWEDHRSPEEHPAENL